MPRRPATDPLKPSPGETSGLQPAIDRIAQPGLVVLIITGGILGGLLIGFEPIGGDPDRLYRPLKQELARFLAEGRLPFWSDRLGLGLPLLAESHVAALYPLNWILYGLGDVGRAYRLSMWLHHLLLAGATYAYGRQLSLSGWGAAVAALALTFSGFQGIHSSHEPFYQALAYLPLALWLTERYVASGSRLTLLLLALAWGAQLTLGHFQLQFWTAGLVLILGSWRTLADRRPWSRPLGLLTALAWGGTMTLVQLTATWELAQVVGFTNRPFEELAFFSFPLAHWAELAIPFLHRGIPGGPDAPYWYSLGTSGYEAHFSIGTIPLILAFQGIGRPNRRLTPWLAVGAIATSLAVLPTAWPEAYEAILRIPGLGWFRSPARYLVISSLGLSLFAGWGLTQLLERGTDWGRLLLALVLLIAAVAWGAVWAYLPQNRAVLAGPRLAWVLGGAVVVWILALGLVATCGRGRLPPLVLLVAMAGELATLYYTSTTVWGWAIRLPTASPILDRLAREPEVGRVAGLVHNLPLRAGTIPVYPYTGFALPPPHPLLELATRREEAAAPLGRARLHRHGVTHGIWDGPVPESDLEILLEGPDPTLDRLVYKPPGSAPQADWKLVRYPSPFPQIRVATRMRVVAEPKILIAALGVDFDPRTVWYRDGDQPLEAAGAAATSARVISWDGSSAVVEHNGSCILVIGRTHYPGWRARIEGAQELPVHRAEGGIQSVLLQGSGTSRVTLQYQPGGLWYSAPISLAALLTALGLVVAELAGKPGRRSGPSPPPTNGSVSRIRSP